MYPKMRGIWRFLICALYHVTQFNTQLHKKYQIHSSGMTFIYDIIITIKYLSKLFASNVWKHIKSGECLLSRFCSLILFDEYILKTGLSGLWPRPFPFGGTLDFKLLSQIWLIYEFIVDLEMEFRVFGLQTRISKHFYEFVLCKHNRFLSKINFWCLVALLGYLHNNHSL